VSVGWEMAAVLPVGLARNPNRWECWWGAAAHGEPRTVCVHPPPLYMALATGAHQPQKVGRPRSGRVRGERIESLDYYWWGKICMYVNGRWIGATPVIFFFRATTPGMFFLGKPIAVCECHYIIQISERPAVNMGFRMPQSHSWATDP
jgi:hypothetical protein